MCLGTPRASVTTLSFGHGASRQMPGDPESPWPESHLRKEEEAAWWAGRRPPHPQWGHW